MSDRAPCQEEEDEDEDEENEEDENDEYNVDLFRGCLLSRFPFFLFD